MLALPYVAMAASGVDVGRQGSLTLSLSAADVRFDLYRVADISETASFTLTGRFRDYPVRLEGEDAGEWRKLSATLAAYAAADQIPSDRVIYTDETGKARAEAVKPGLYLAVGQPYEADGKRYVMEAALISVPGKDAAGEWVYDVAVQPKQEASDRKLTSAEVMKIWKDGDATDRPERVTVQLLRDGKVYEQVALNQDNNWRYEWKNLDGESLWQVIERPVPSGYTVDIDVEGTLTTITNERDDDEKTPGGGGGGLPQTGLNWVPVWLSAAAGMALFVAGWLKSRAEKREA